MNETATPASTGRKLTLGLLVGDSSAGWTGGMVYLGNVVKCLASLPPEERPDVTLIHDGVKTLEKFSAITKYDFVRPARYPIPSRWIPSRYGQSIVHFTRRLMEVLGVRGGAAGVGAVDVTFGFANYPGINAVHIYWIPDFQHRRLPQFFTPEDAALRVKEHNLVAGRQGILLLSSQASARDFAEFHPGAAITPRVWSFVSDYTPEELAGPDPTAKYNLPEKYLYLPNQFWAHKDHITAFAAIKTLADAGEPVDLVCTGLMNDYRAPGHTQKLLDYIATNGLSERIKVLGLVPREDQVQIFRHAAAVLQPSLFEGWSTTIEDSKALGKTLIMSDLPVHQEQAEGYPFPSHFFRMQDAADLARTIKRLWPGLAAGPDMAAEKKAAEYTTQRKIAAGRLFVRHAREAVTLAGRG